MGISRHVTFVLSGLALSACATVPPLSEATGSIPVRDIVERVKCELADSFSKKMLQPDFLWLQNWTAKVDLSLAANNLGSITPAGTYIEPLKTVSGVAQQFGIGAGATISGQAFRTEAVSFSLSLIELEQWRDDVLRASARDGIPDPCYPGLRTDLAGDLGLREWADSSLTPVAFRDLQAGDHPAPSTAKSAAPAAGGGKGAGIAADKQPKQRAMAAVGKAEAAYKDAEKSAEAAAKSARLAVGALSLSPYRYVEDPVFLAKTKRIIAAAAEQANSAQQEESQAKSDHDKAESLYT
jgi:hypothetical protein